MINTALTDLNLWNNTIGASGVASFSEALSVNTTLTDLNVKGQNKVDAPVGISIPKALSVSTALTDLYLSDNNITFTD